MEKQTVIDHRSRPTNRVYLLLLDSYLDFAFEDKRNI